MSFAISDVPLRSFLEQAVAANQAFADVHQVRLHLEHVPNEAIVRFDPDRLMQVITNLLSNGVKFSPAGAVVCINVRQLNRRWRVSIADQGSGISPEFRNRIFQKFAQADSSDSRAKGGTGLGLSIVREIMTRLGGAISFDSKEGEGATFHVDIPSAEEEPAHCGEICRSTATVLHVDDDPDLSRVVVSALERLAVVDTVPSLETARKALTSRAYRLLILDIGLADGSGLDLLAETKVPTIVFTAQEADPQLKDRVEAVLIKSRANLDQLTAEVDRVLSKG
jgi:CheY-like chemotaxis protein/two-component sensor histidine kinase